MEKKRKKNGVNYPLKSRGGFTLIELILVVTIMGILSSMAAVSFAQRADKDRVLASGRMAASFLSAMTSQAKQLQQNYSVEFVGDQVLAYDSAGCSAGTGSVVNTLDLRDATSFAVRSGATYSTLLTGTGLPTTIPSIPISGKYTSDSWTTSHCVEMVNHIGNPIASAGWVMLTSDVSGNYGYILLKSDDDNRLQEWLYENGVWKKQ